MRLIQGLMLHDTPEGTIAVATGEAAKVLNGMLRLSDTAAFILRHMEKETTEDEVVAAITAEYRVDEARAREDFKTLVGQLDGAGLIVW